MTSPGVTVCRTTPLRDAARLMRDSGSITLVAVD
jgi:CBS domain-containing protein